MKFIILIACALILTSCYNIKVFTISQYVRNDNIIKGDTSIIIFVNANGDITNIECGKNGCIKY